ncbi:MAK10-like protein [Tanacetum coccineum]
MAFGGYTRDMGSFGEETDKITTLHRSGFKNCSQSLETASQFLATPSDHTRDSIRKFMMTSEHSFLKRNPRRFGEATASENLRRSINTWEDLTTRFLAQFFPPGRTAKLRNDILMFQQHQESWALLKDLALYDNKSWNDPRDFAKPIKVISLPQDVLSTSDCRLIELENQVQRLMEAHLAPKSSVQVNKVASLCEICSGPRNT